ncbi:MAG: 4Fe-4S dicluster domain-containing protein [Chloroflexi bacterium]|nr:4Fe-4S dicluster domain-containing protein [Chloroflexota bacterium]
MIDLLALTAERDAPAADDLARCVHCGLCLENCPTYLETGKETESPRGRIHLIQALQEGRIEATGAFTQHIDRCLVCRACEAVCPSGVPFGRIMEAARADLKERREPVWTNRFTYWLLFKKLLPNRRRLRALASGLRWYQRSGLQHAVRASGVLASLPATLGQMERSMPSLPDHFFEAEGHFLPALGPARYRVGFFSGCVMPLAYGPVHEATIRVLRRNGCDVVVPRVQACCGALNVHSGERMMARELARRNVRAFLDLDVDYVVVNSAGCGSTLKEYAELLAGDPLWREWAERFGSRVRDVSELLVDLPFQQGLGPVRRRVTLQESCHLVHAQRVKAPPRALLAAIPELELVDMAHPDNCCGSAGIYSFAQPELSNQILDTRMAEVRATSADLIVTSNPGCMLQLQAGLERTGQRVEVRHLIEVLDWSYQSGTGQPPSGRASL